MQLSRRGSSLGQSQTPESRVFIISLSMYCSRYNKIHFWFPGECMGGKGRYQKEKQRAGKPNSICGSWATLKKTEQHWWSRLCVAPFQTASAGVCTFWYCPRGECHPQGWPLLPGIFRINSLLVLWGWVGFFKNTWKSLVASLGDNSRWSTCYLFHFYWNKIYLTAMRLIFCAVLEVNLPRAMVFKLLRNYP